MKNNMDKSQAVWLWNSLTMVPVCDGASRTTDLGCVAISHGLSTSLASGNLDAHDAEERSKVAAFLRSWADLISDDDAGQRPDPLWTPTPGKVGS